MIRVIALTEAGLLLAERLARALGNASVWFKPEPFTAEVQAAFERGERLIFICATGIVVRTLAPVIQNKHQDPAVLVLDEAGRFVVPLLSGHEGGANEWGRQVSELLSAQLVVTTANPYLKPVYSVGMGCERGCPMAELEQLLRACLQQSGLTLGQLSAIGSIDLKADEDGLIALGEKFELPFEAWPKPVLATMESQLSCKSEYVYNTVGVYGVAESAALVSASHRTGQPAELVLTKQKTAKATCAIARSFPAAGSF